MIFSRFRLQKKQKTYQNHGSVAAGEKGGAPKAMPDIDVVYSMNWHNRCLLHKINDFSGRGPASPMIVLSVGMQKSGSAWYFNLINEVLIAAGYHDARTIRDRFGLQSILQYGNCNIEELTPEKLSRVVALHNSGYTFAVKTHCGPTPIVASLLAEDIIKATYVYRDPRDVVISAMDHGRKIRNSSQNHTFAEYDSLEKTVYAVKEWLVIWERWRRLNRVLTVRYEDLLADPLKELKRLSSFLAIVVSSEKIQTILNRYKRENLDATNTDLLHFNAGVSERFKEVMSSQAQAYCLQHFGGYLHKMGYAL